MSNTGTVSQGREYLAIPGPSVMPDAVLQAMHRAAPNIYTGELVQLTDGLIPDLCRVARTEHNVAMYICNGHGVWEAALANTVAGGEKVLALATGRFGEGWAGTAQAMGIEAEILDFGNRTTWDLDRVADTLRADSDHRIKAVLAVHVDTSTSVRNNIADLRSLLDQEGHPALLMVDCIASLACDRFDMDSWGVDVMIAASQKGLMVPPGLGFVFFNPRAGQRRAGLTNVSRYWDWTQRVNPQEYYQYFNGTAPTHHLYGLRVALDMIMGEGLDHVHNRHEILARALWAACEVWAIQGAVSLNIADPDTRSHAVTTLRMDAPNGRRLRDWTERELGLTLGIGLGMATSSDPGSTAVFRIGHMGHVNGHMMLGVIGGIEAGLTALDIPHGKGAVEAAARLIARAAQDQ
ncbi:MAG: aminotransferase class V-fold PLP-dependent enzyme [Pseudomonadota bacterium]